MKKIFFILTIMSTFISSQAKQDPFIIGSSEYNIKDPYQSKGLTKVDMSVKDGIPPLEIAENGNALVPIVCPKVNYYREVAKLLKEYLDQATGGNFVVTSEVPEKGRAIFIGDCELPEIKEIAEKVKAMPDESFLIDSIPQGIVLLGKDALCRNRLKNKDGIDVYDRKQSRGTFFAMVDFLERLIGVRFYFPRIGIHIPNLRDVKVEIPPVSYSDAPVFDFRDLGYGSGSDIKFDSQDVNDWNLFSRLADINLKESWHTDNKWHNVFGETHPEYFALRSDGSRTIGDKGKYSAYRCYSSDEGFKAHIKAIENYYKTSEGKELFGGDRRDFAPNKKYIHWGIADAFRGCHCEKCRKLTSEGSDFGIYSNIVWKYVIKLAKECKKRWPDKILKVHVYGKYRFIPEFVKEENPGNLLICPVRVGPQSTSAAFLKEPLLWNKAQNFIDMLDDISAEKPYLWLHYPHRPLSGAPCLVPHYYQKFIFDNKDKLSGMLFNGHRSYSVSLNSLIVYIMYKISWNPDMDVDSCIDEYCQTLFGPAAKEVGEYYKTVVDRWENVKWKKVPAEGSLDSVLPKSCYWRETFPLRIRNQLEKSLQTALSKTQKGTIYHDRVLFLVKGTAPFFEQGRRFDLGKTYKITCYKWNPGEMDGWLKAWHANGVSSLDLHSNDNGKKEDDVLKGKIYLSHDSGKLFIAGRIDSVDGFITKGEKQKRDSDIWRYDSLEVFICSEQPGMEEAGLAQTGQYHQIIIDPQGSIWDGYKSGEMDNGLNFNIDCKINLLKKKNRLYFEMAIPFSELKCAPPKEGSVWYMNFYWNRWRDGKHVSYTWAGTGAHHDTSRFGIVEFSMNAPPQKKIQNAAMPK